MAISTNNATFLDGLLGQTDGKTLTTVSKVGTLTMIIVISLVLLFTAKAVMSYFEDVSDKRNERAIQAKRDQAAELKAERALYAPKKKKNTNMLPMLAMSGMMDF